MHRVIYFEDIQSNPPSFPVSRLVCFGKRIAQYNGSGPGEFFLAKRQIPVNSTELLYFALSFCSGTLIVLGPSRRPLYSPTQSRPSVQTFTPGDDKNKRKLFGKLCSRRLVFPNQKVGKIGIVF